MWLVLMVRLTSVPFSEKNRSIFMLARKGHWKMDGSKANRFLIGGTLLAFNDPKLEAFVCEMRQACEDGELFDN